MFSHAMVGSDAFVPVHDAPDPCRGERLLADAMIAQAIRDIKKPKYRASAMRWVNDTQARYVTAFKSCCDILDKPYGPLRDRINRYAKSGKNLNKVNDGGLKGNRGGRKKTNICIQDGCTRPTAGKRCARCANVYGNRRFRHPDRPDLWNLPVGPKGGYRKLEEYKVGR